MESRAETSILPGKNVKVDQRAWKYIQEINSTSAACQNKVALNDGVKSYTYGLMFRMWERYASFFTAIIKIVKPVLQLFCSTGPYYYSNSSAAFLSKALISRC